MFGPRGPMRIGYIGVDRLTGDRPRDGHGGRRTWRAMRSCPLAASAMWKGRFPQLHWKPGGVSGGRPGRDNDGGARLWRSPLGPRRRSTRGWANWRGRIQICSTLGRCRAATWEAMHGVPRATSHPGNGRWPMGFNSRSVNGKAEWTAGYIISEHWRDRDRPT